MSEKITVHTGLATEENRDEWLKVRARNINSSEVAALFGMSPYMTEFELWHLKKGNIPDSFEGNDRTEAGQFLEPAIAALAAHKNGWKSRPFKDYFEDAEARTGSSFDWIIDAWEGAPEGCEGPGIKEIKNVDFFVFGGRDRKWNGDDPENILAPYHIELQLQHQLLLTGYKWAVIVVLVGGNDMKISVRFRNEKIISKIRDRIAEFWKSIDENTPPDPDFTRDLSAIKALYARPDPTKVLPEDVQPRLVELVRDASELAGQRKEIEAREDAAKAEMMHLIGEVNEKAVLPDGSSVSWKADKNGRRSLRFTAAKMEEAA